MNLFKKRKKCTGFTPKCLHDLGSSFFDHAIRFLDDCIKWNDSSWKDQIAILDYMMLVVRNDLKYGLASDILYSDKARDYAPYIFLYYWNEKGERLGIDEGRTDGIKVLDFSKDCVIGIPWDGPRIWDNLSSIRKRFEQDNNHQVRYIQEMDVAFIRSGNHSITIGSVFGKGCLSCDVISFESVFPSVVTDGRYWINTHTNKKFDDVCDYRVAILYELARRKFEILKRQEE